MNFLNEKKQALNKITKFDNSKKGSIDKQIIDLINLINKHSNYYTTSSCSGRIMVIKPSKVKYEAEWLFSSHEVVSVEEVKKSLTKLPDETIWLRMEPPIIHVCAKDIDSADLLLKKANNAGFRRSAVLSLKKRLMIEIMIPEKMDVPIAENSELIVSEDYLRKLIGYANIKLEKAHSRLKKLERLFKKK